MFPALKSGDFLQIDHSRSPSLGELIFCQFGNEKMVHRLVLQNYVKGDRNKHPDGKLENCVFLGCVSKLPKRRRHWARFFDRSLGIASFFNDRKFRGLHHFFSSLVYLFGFLRRWLC